MTFGRRDRGILIIGAIGLTVSLLAAALGLFLTGYAIREGWWLTLPLSGAVAYVGILRSYQIVTYVNRHGPVLGLVRWAFTITRTPLPDEFKEDS